MVSQKRIDKKIAEIRRDIEDTERRVREGKANSRMELNVLHSNLAALIGGRGLVGHFLFQHEE